MQKIGQIVKKPLFWVWIAVAVGSFLRLFALDRWPMGLHHDEAYSAYNAWSIMNYGIDAAGYGHPVYYPVYGSGMSVLYSYLTMPFLALFGSTAVAIRLPQAILGCVSVWAAYVLGKEILNEKAGAVFALLLAINPWHIKQSRFGWDANLAVPMFLFAVVFLCRYLNGKKKSVIPAGLFFGLTLYCYALTWMLVPMFLFGCLIVFFKRIKIDKYTVCGVGLLFVLAVPLLLFLAVNFGWIPEIKTAWISVPKLAQMRTDELSLSGIKANIAWNAVMLFRQYDDIWWNTSPVVGSYYFVSMPFILAGIFRHLKRAFVSIKEKKRLPLELVMLVWLLAMLFVSCTVQHAKFYKLNELHIPMIFYTAYGVLGVLKLLRNNKVVTGVLIGVYVFSFGRFVYDEVAYPVNYENYGQSALTRMHWNEYGGALDAAKEKTDGNISIINLSYVNVLLHEKYPPADFRKDAVYVGDNMAFRTLRSFGRFYFEVWPSEQTEGWVFVIPYGAEDSFLQMGYTVEHITDCYGIAYEK